MTDANDGVAQSEDDETIYDSYLDALAEGRIEEPHAFFASHPGGGSALRDRISAMHRMLVAGTPPRAARTDGAPPRAGSSPADAGLPFARLGDFRLLRRLDEGGMGTVYLAEQESLARTVALKVIRPELQGSADAAERFRREALAVARLRHENVVAVHAVGEDGGVRWIAMEYVPGRGLDEILADAASRGVRVPASDAVRWAARIARALDAAHRAGIVHRDVKPSNVRITPEGKPLLLDFGIARELGAEGMTRSAPFLGSPAYAAPEQIAGAADSADARTDVYSLGVMLYECLGGRTPWRAATLEQVFLAILSQEAARLRVLDPSIARDVEVVVAKAMEKEPSRRYETAAAFADDLEALLEFRPVRARPSTAFSRLVKWSRRRPGLAAAGVTVTAALAALGVLLVSQARSAALTRRQDAASAVAAAGARVAAYRERRAASQELERQVDAAHLVQASMYLEAADERLLEENEDAVAAFRRDREAVFHEVLDLVRRAESLDPAVDGADRVRAELYREKWSEAVDTGDPAAAAHYREKLLANDPDGRMATEVAGSGSLHVISDPPGAEVHAFRYREQSDVVPGGDKRLVPVPWRGADATVPGSWALEVTTGAAALRPGDLVLAIDGTPIRDLAPAAARARAARGGGAARIAREGRHFDAELPAGLAVRLTAAPVPISPQSLLGATPLTDARLEPGSYLFLLRREGYEDLRCPWTVTRGVPTHVAAKLFPGGTTPSGFVRVATAAGGALWIMEREITSQEYLVFLNDPATLREIAGSPAPIRVPRRLESLVRGGTWPPAAGGGYALPPRWGPDWPVLGVSLEDARSYAQWRTARARTGGADVTYALPTHDEWAAAGHGSGDRQFPYGNRFRPKWASSCFAQRQAMPSAVLSYPLDESPYGAFDLSGSALEWCDSWYDEGRGLHRLAGGSWARGVARELAIWSPTGGAADSTTDETGFRLVIRRPAEKK